MDDIQVVTNISSLITAIATLFIMWATVTYKNLTRKIVELETQPHVIVSVAHDNHRPTMFLIIIKNIGKGVARNITFSSNDTIFQQVWGLDVHSAKQANVMIDGPIISGIKFLGPGEFRTINWAQYAGLLKNYGECNPEIFCTYFNDRGEQLKSNCILDWKSFAATDAAGSAENKIAQKYDSMNKNLEQINKHLHSISKTIEK